MKQKLLARKSRLSVAAGTLPTILAPPRTVHYLARRITFSSQLFAASAFLHLTKTAALRSARGKLRLSQHCFGRCEECAREAEVSDQHGVCIADREDSVYFGAPGRTRAAQSSSPAGWNSRKDRTANCNVQTESGCGRIFRDQVHRLRQSYAQVSRKGD